MYRSGLPVIVISKLNKVYLGYVDAVNDIVDGMMFTFWDDLADVSARSIITITLAHWNFVVVILQRNVFVVKVSRIGLTSF